MGEERHVAYITLGDIYGHGFGPLLVIHRELGGVGGWWAGGHGMAMGVGALMGLLGDCESGEGAVCFCWGDE